MKERKESRIREQLKYFVCLETESSTRSQKEDNMINIEWYLESISKIKKAKM